MRKGQIVKITWRDIREDLCTEELHDPPVAYNVGMVAKQDRKNVWVKSGWYADEKEWPSKSTAVIPKGCIDKVEVL